MTLNIKSTIATIAILALIGLGVGVGATAATEVGVSATVTVENIAVSVSDGTVAYGTLAVNTSQDTLSGNLNDIQTATNNGNITATLNIKGVNSADWTLEAAAGADQYKHEFSTDSFTGATALTTSYQELAAGVAADGTQAFDLRITTPTSSTNFDQQSVNVTVQITL